MPWSAIIKLNKTRDNYTLDIIKIVDESLTIVGNICYMRGGRYGHFVDIKSNGRQDK